MNAREFRILSALVLFTVFAAGTSAQITLQNTGSGGPAVATTGPGAQHSVDSSTFMFGGGSVLRGTIPTGAANAAYLPTGWAVDPTADGSIAQTRAGFTIQFWYNTPLGTTFHYVLGDSSWVGANGAFRVFAGGGQAGVGGIIVRGPLNQLVSSANAFANGMTTSGFPGWVHVTLVYDHAGGHYTGSIPGSFTWYINGVRDTGGTAAANITGSGTNLTIMGYNGSSTVGPTGHVDEYRLYDYARPEADIMADWNQETLLIAGTPSGESFIPTRGLYQCNQGFNPHIAEIASDAVPSPVLHTTTTKLFTGGRQIRWQGTTPQTPTATPLASGLLNFDGPFAGGTPVTNPRELAFRTAPPMTTSISQLAPSISGLELGHFFSNPPVALSFVYPDGLGIGPLISPVSLPVPYAMNSGTLGIFIPPVLFVPGDRIDVQYISVDNGLSISNRCTFLYVDPVPGPNCHVEARGVATLQDTGFWEIWNTGDTPIQDVIIDLGPVGDFFEPGGALNSGGTLQGGDSIRFSTGLHAGYSSYVPAPGSTIGTVAGSESALQFNFNGSDFEGPIDHFIFDCDTTNAGGGGSFAGAMITVHYVGGVTAGPLPLVLDPAPNTNGAQVDL